MIHGFVKELRTVAANEVERLNKENPNGNWTYKMLKKSDFVPINPA
jgi:hypothetical protein